MTSSLGCHSALMGLWVLGCGVGRGLVDTGGTHLVLGRLRTMVSGPLAASAVASGRQLNWPIAARHRGMGLDSLDSARSPEA